MIKNKKLIGYICALIAVALWGIHPIVIRHLTLQNVESDLIAFLRLFLGSIFLLFVLSLNFFKKKNDKKFNLAIPYDIFFWLAVVALAINFILFHWGLDLTFASNVMLIETFAPIFVLLFLILFLPHRVPFLRKKTNLVIRLLFIVLIGSVGSSLLLMNKPMDINIDYQYKMWGDLLSFFAMLFFSLFCIGSNEYKKTHMSTNSILTTAHFLFFAAFILFFVLAFSFDIDKIFQITKDQWLWLLFLGIFPTGLSYTLWHKASKYLKLVSLTLLFNLSAIFTVILEGLVFGTSITWKVILAALFIISASVLAELTYKEGLKDVETKQLG